MSTPDFKSPFAANRRHSEFGNTSKGKTSNVIGIDERQNILKQIKTETPRFNCNRQKIIEIIKNAKNKIDYPYKGKFNSLYDELVKTGRIVREDSWTRFIMPEKVGPYNHIQKALHVTQVNSNRETVTQTQDGRDESSSRFRNQFEQFHYLFAEEKSENITVQQTQARLVEANRKFESVILKAKPELKLF